MSMLCPVCRKELQKWQMLHLQTLDEHICNPNDLPLLKRAYRCPDQKCPTRIYDIFWNRAGERYSDKYITSEERKAIPFIDNNDAPFGTFQRRINVEVYKKDENKEIVRLPKWFPGVFSGMKICTEWGYTSNNDGKILKRRLGFKYIRKDGMYHIWGIRMVIYGLREIIRQYRYLRKNSQNVHARKELESDIERSTWHDAEWWRKVNAFFAKIALKAIG